MRRALSLRIHVLFNLRCLMKPTQKVYLERYSLTSRRAGINFLPSLVPCTGSEKSVRFRLSPRFVSVKSYVVSWVASQDGFSRILELRFQKVITGLRLLSSS